MSFSLNKISLIGNLGQDAEHKFTTNNTEVSNFSLATSYSYKGKDGNWVNETTWHNIVAFKLSDFLKGKLKKGAKIYLEGRLSKRKYKNKDGVEVNVSEVIADNYSIIPLSDDTVQATVQDDLQNPSKAVEEEPQNNDLPF